MAALDRGGAVEGLLRLDLDIAGARNGVDRRAPLLQGALDEVLGLLRIDHRLAAAGRRKQERKRGDWQRDTDEAVHEAPFRRTDRRQYAVPGGSLGSAAAMRFYEYESRRIVERAGIPVTKYGFCTTPDEARKAAEDIGGPVVIKSQVLTGGRMKAGGVKFADTPEEAAEHAAAILELEISGHMPKGVLVDPKAEVAQEYYASVVWDGTRKCPLMLFSDMGGIDIEEVASKHPDHVGRGHLSNLLPISDFHAKQAIAATGVTGSELNRATPILARLAQLQRDYDMTLAEINPLARLTNGTFVALDAHMEMEAEAK